ncbi:MAG: DUF2235 domain-containing protein [Candidatus Thiodiazotropha endolucinida]
MKFENFGSVTIYQLSTLPLVLLIGSLVIWFAGCTGNPTLTSEPHTYFTSVMPLTGDITQTKKILVFLDGTANNPGSETNVWKLYQRINNNSDRQTTAIYIAGVGSAESAPLTEAVLGHGMEERILDGYRFIVENYTPKDEIMLFGFSRGAHQARTLAGLISYAGIMQLTDDVGSVATDSNRIIELVKKQRDADHILEWHTWSKNQPPILATEISRKLGIQVLPASIKFLGVWDTVPGSSLKNYGVCKEDIGVVKDNLSFFIPGVDRGERYKTDSYPAISYIAHAVSLDEKRSKFAPLLVCDPIVADLTTVNETWFPGAHADVGGGYEDSNDLSNLSLNWMIEQLKRHYTLSPEPPYASDPAGLAHWSMEDKPANAMSKCSDRVPPLNSQIHQSVSARRSMGAVPVRWKGEKKWMAYPIGCKQQ